MTGSTPADMVREIPPHVTSSTRLILLVVGTIDRGGCRFNSVIIDYFKLADIDYNLFLCSQVDSHAFFFFFASSHAHLEANFSVFQV